MKRGAWITIAIAALFYSVNAQYEPTDLNYLKISWKNHLSYIPVSYYTVYKFTTATDTMVTADTDSINQNYSYINNYGVFFANLTVDDTAYFRIRSTNNYGKSLISPVFTGLISSSFVPDIATLSYNKATIEWSSLFSGQTTRRYIKMATSQDLLLETDNEYYYGGEQSNNATVTIELPANLPANTTHYFFAYETADNGNCISSTVLSFTTEPQPAVEPDSTESNDSFAMAFAVEEGESVKGFIWPQNDSDYFVIDNLDTDSLIIAATSVPFSLTFSVYDGNFNLLASAAAASVLNIPTATGGSSTCYIAVNGNNGYYSCENGYTFTVNTINSVNEHGTPTTDHFVGPNPYVAGKNSETGFVFRGLQNGYKISVYDLHLNRIITIKPATADITWELINKNGKNIAPGVYVYIITDQNGKQIEKGKLVYIK